MINTNPGLIVVDVREQSEYCDELTTSPPPGHIPGALNYPWVSGYLEDHYEELPVGADILVVCRGGTRSALAAQFLCGEQGFTAVSNMLGGMLAWEGETETWPCCDTAQDCDDGLFCTGAETCVDFICQPSSDPCAAPYYRCDEDNDQCVECPGDYDCDGVSDLIDNCMHSANGPDSGACARNAGGVMLGTGVECAIDDDCLTGEFCQKNQEDCNSNTIGDACECYADIDCNIKVDLADLVIVKDEFLDSCPPSACGADLNDDDKVDLSDLVIMKTQFLRNACPACTQ